ncbi:MAG: MopE-related protein [Myxococcota bacterium]
MISRFRLRWTVRCHRVRPYGHALVCAFGFVACDSSAPQLPDARPDAVRVVPAEDLPKWAVQPQSLMRSNPADQASSRTQQDSGEIDVARVVSRISNAFRRPSDLEAKGQRVSEPSPSRSSNSRSVSEFLAARGETYRGELDGVGLRFSPDLPSRDHARRWSKFDGYAVKAEDIESLPREPTDDPTTSLRIRTLAVKLGDTRIDEIPAEEAQWLVTGNTAQALRSKRFGLVEHVAARDLEVEQSWWLRERPEGSGPLTVDISLEGLEFDPRRSQPGRTAFHLRDDQGRTRVRYGEALLVDSAGARTRLESEPTPGGLRIIVPGALLADAEFPIFIDPVIESEFAIPSADSETRGSQRDPQIAPTSSGALVVWEDVRDEPGARFHITAHADDVGREQSGDQQDVALARVGDNIVAVYEHDGGIGARQLNSELTPGRHKTVTRNGTDPEVACAGSSCLVAWVRDGDVYVTSLWSLEELHVGTTDRVTEDAAAQGHPAIATNGDDYLLVWQDERHGSSAIYGARVEPTPIVFPEDRGGFLIASADGAQTHPRVASDGTDYRVVWDDGRGGEYRVFGASVSANSSGAPVSQQISNFPNAECRHPDVAFNGERFLNVFRCGGGVMGAAQLISGEIVSQDHMSYGTDGEQRNYRPRIAADPYGEWLVTYVHERSTNEFEHVFTTRVSPEGLAKERTLYFDGGFLDGLKGQVAVGLPDGGFLVAWDSPDGDGQAVDARPLHLRRTVSGTRLREDLSVVDYDGFAIAQDGRAPALACIGDECLIAYETLGLENGINARSIRVDASPEPPQVGENAIEFSTHGRRSNVALTAGSDGFLAVWEDSRAGGPALFGARFSAAGDVVPADNGGVSLLDASASRRWPDVVFTGSGYRLVWTDGALDYSTVNTAVIDLDTLAVSEQEIAVERIGVDQTRGSLAALSDGHVLIAASTAGHLVNVRRRSESRWLDGLPIQIGRGSLTDVTASAAGDSYLVASSTAVGYTQLRFWAIERAGDPDEPLEYIHRDSHLNSRLDVMPFRDEFVVAFDRSIEVSEAVSVAFVAPNREVYGEGTASREWIDASSLVVPAGNANRPAADGIGDRYLVVWDYDRFEQGIYATRMRAGVLEEHEPGAWVNARSLWQDRVPFQISSVGVAPDIACSEHQCLVVWRVDDEQGSHVRATLIHPASGYVVTPNGQRLSSDSEDVVGRPRVASNNDEFVVVWSDSGERIRRYETRSDVLGEWSAETLSDMEGAESEPAIASDDRDFVVTWSRIDDGTPTIVAAQINEDGRPLAFTEIVSDAAGVSQPSIAHNGSDGFGGYLLGWQHGDATNARVRFTRLTSDLDVMDPPNGVDIARDCGRPEITSRTDVDSWLIGCLDSENDALEITRVELDGTISHHGLWRTNQPHETHDIALTGTRFGMLALLAETQRYYGRDRSVILAVNYDDTLPGTRTVHFVSDTFSAPADQRNPTITTSDTHHLVVWEDTRGPGRTIWGTRLTFDGHVTHPDGIEIGDRYSELNERSPSVATNGDSFLVTFMRDADSPKAYARMVGKDGRPTGAEVDLGIQDYAVVASDGTDYLIAFTRGGELYGRRITSTGVADGDAFSVISEGFALPEGNSVALRPTMSFSHEHYVLSYEAWSSQGDIGFALLDRNGAKLSGYPRAVATGSADEVRPRIVGTREGSALVWSDLGSGEIRLSLFDPAGRTDATVDGSSVGTGVAAPVIAASENSVMVLWSDSENGTRVRRSTYDLLDDVFLGHGEVVTTGDESFGGVSLSGAPGDAFTMVYHRLSSRELFEDPGGTRDDFSSSALQIFARTLHVFDRDGDGLPSALDCDDGDDTIGERTLLFTDADGDGFGDASSPGFLGCLGGTGGEEQPGVTNKDDCDDSSAATNPDAAEAYANDVDENCDAVYACLDDIDGDGKVGVFEHDGPCGTDFPATELEDCDETNALIYSGAVEIVASGVDEDCDGQELCYADADGDGFGTPETVASMDMGCDGVGESDTDQDCDDSPDGGEIFGPSLWYPDRDGDGFGDANSTAVSRSCGPFLGAVSDHSDCDDNDSAIHPDADEICSDDSDSDCDGYLDSADCYVAECSASLFKGGTRIVDEAFSPTARPATLYVEGLYSDDAAVELEALGNFFVQLDADGQSGRMGGRFVVKALYAPSTVAGLVGDIWALSVHFGVDEDCPGAGCAPVEPAAIRDAPIEQWRFYRPQEATLSSFSLIDRNNEMTYDHDLAVNTATSLIQIGPSANTHSLACGLRFDFEHASRLRFSERPPPQTHAGRLILDLVTLENTQELTQ